MIIDIKSKKDALNVFTGAGKFTITHICDECESEVKSIVDMSESSIESFKSSNKIITTTTCKCGDVINEIHIVNMTTISTEDHSIIEIEDDLDDDAKRQFEMDLSVG